MSNHTIFSGQTYCPILSFSLNKRGRFEFPSDVEPDEIAERINFVPKSGDYGSEADTIPLFKAAVQYYKRENKN